jgi:hypothetical protein
MLFIKRITLINFFVLTAILSGIGSAAQYGWNLEKDKNGIKVFSRTNELSKFKQIRVVCALDDVAVHLNILQDSVTKVMTILADCIPNYIPVKEDIVRVPVSKAIWKVTPSGAGRIYIDYQLQVDVGGNVPSWIFNMFISRGPYESFKNLKEEIHLNKYTTTILPFIIN